MENGSDKAKEWADVVSEAESQFNDCNSDMTTVHKGNGFSWDDREELFFGGWSRVNKDTQKRERYMDSTGELVTLAIDRACRVMAQLPSGRFENLSGETGKNLLMNLIFQHYVIPNARTGGSMKTKLRMANLYSDLYSIPAFVEWTSGPEYTGPDMILVNPRRFYPQAGKASIAEMDYCFIDTFPSKEWIKTRSDKYFHNTKEIAAKAAETGPEAQEVGQRDRLDKQSGVRIRHKFSRNGDWLAYNPDTKLVLVDEKGWYPRIPVVLKHQIPRIGSLWSYTNFERGYATQKKIDVHSAMNDRAVEMMIDPPAIMDPADVILSSFKRQARAKWFVKNGKTDAIKFPIIAPQALAAHSQNYQILKANLLSMGASTDTAVTDKADPGFGKTPEALKQQGMRRGARDKWDQDMQEEFIEEVFTLMADMIASKGVDKYSFILMEDAIRNLEEEYPEEDFSSFLNGNQADIDVKMIEGKYRYVMEPGSTLIEQDDTAEAIMEMLKLHAENPNIAKDLGMRGERLDYGAAYKMILRAKGSKFADKIIVSSNNNPEAVAGVGSDGATVNPQEQAAQPMEDQPVSDQPIIPQA
jgi:hypothetical protein